MKTIDIRLYNKKLASTELYTDGRYLCVTRSYRLYTENKLVPNGYAVTHKNTGSAVCYFHDLRMARKWFNILNSDNQIWNFTTLPTENVLPYVRDYVLQNKEKIREDGGWFG